MSIEKLISFHIERQFPAIYREEGRELVEFVKEYYKFLESTPNQSLYNGRRLYDYRDIDSTLERMLLFFKNKYLADLPFDDETVRIVVKNILGLYRRKGTQEGLELFFRLFYNESISVYYPSRDMLRPSDSEWNKGTYLEIFPNNGLFTSTKTDNTYTYKDILGRTIFGEASRAKAVVDKINFIIVNNSIFPVIFIDQLNDDFIKLETIVCEIDGVSIGFGQIKGSLSTIDVNTRAREASLGNEVGDLVVFDTSQGIGGEGLVTKVTETFTGFVSYEVEDGGWGYSIGTTRLLASNQIVFIDESEENTSGEILNIFPGESVIDNLGNIGIITGRGDFGVGIRASANSVFVANSIIESSDIADRNVLNSFKILPEPFYSATSTLPEAILRAALSLEPEATRFNAIVSGSRKLGDINDDGLLNATDALELLKYINGVQEDPDIIDYIEGEFKDYLEANAATYGDYPASKFLQVRVVDKNDSSPGDLYPDTANTADVIVSELTNVQEVSLIFDIIGDFTNVQLNSSNYNDVPPALRPMSGNTDPVTINTPLEDAFDVSPFNIGTIVDFNNIDPGTDYVNDVYAIAEDSRIFPSLRNNQLITLENIPATLNIGDEVSQSGIKGKVLAIQDRTITVRPYTYYGFNRTDPISYGGKTWPIVAISKDFGYFVLGRNAIINSTTDFGIGKIEEIRITDSGYGYVDREPININILKKDTLEKAGEGIINLGGQGTTGGYWSSLDSHLNGYVKTLAGDGVDEYYDGGERIQDSDYYQEYSYEIQSTVDITEYEEPLKEITHVAGTKVFGRFNLQVTLGSDVDIRSATIENTAEPQDPIIPGEPTVVIPLASSTSVTADATNVTVDAV